MNYAAEWVIREFFAAWSSSNVDEIVGFLSEDAVYTDGPRGPYSGVDAIKVELELMLARVPMTSPNIKVLLARDDTVMVERVDSVQIQGHSFDVEMSGVFQVDGDGRITRWRDYYDLRSIQDRIAAALGAPL